MAQSKMFNRYGPCPTYVPALTSIFGTDVSNANLVGADGVHLTERNLTLLSKAIAKLVSDESTSSDLLLENKIPNKIHLSHWKACFRKKFPFFTPVVTVTHPLEGTETASLKRADKKEQNSLHGVQKNKYKRKRGAQAHNRGHRAGFFPFPNFHSQYNQYFGPPAIGYRPRPY